jgi:hypothetical protein
MKSFLCFVLGINVFLVPMVATAAQKTVTVPGGPLKFTSSMTVQSLAGHPDSEMVRLQNGKLISIATLRTLDAAAKKMRAAKPAPLPQALTIRPAAKGTPASNRAQFMVAFNGHPDSDTLQLPSGRRVTAGQVRLLQPYIEKRLGRKMSDLTQSQNLTGPKVPISSTTTDKSFWQNMLQTPGNDSKVLVSPRGKQVTVGDLKQYLSQTAHTPHGQIQLQRKPAVVPPQSGQKGE